MRARWSWVLLVVVAGTWSRSARGDDATVTAWRSADASTRAFALRLARRAFDTYVVTREVIEIPRRLPPLLRRRAAVFVSAMVHGAPRCCMGTLHPTEPSAAAEIVASACSAAGRDRRFAPITDRERRTLVLIVSVVGPPRAIAPGQLSSVHPARDGVVAIFRGHVGVTLSGETGSVETMVRWARIRAGASDADAAEVATMPVFRMVEGRGGTGAVLSAKRGW